MIRWPMCHSETAVTGVVSVALLPISTAGYVSRINEHNAVKEYLH